MSGISRDAGRLWRAQRISAGGQAERAGEQHAQGHEEEGVGDGSGDDVVRGHPGAELRAEPVGGSVGERGPRPDDGDPEHGVAEAGAADRLDSLNAQLELSNATLAQLDNEAKLQTAFGALENALQRPADSIAAVIKKISIENSNHSFP